MRFLLLLAMAAGCARAVPAASPHAGHPRAGEPDPDHRGHQHHRGHRFEKAEAWVGHFESTSRDAWQMPNRVVEALALTAAMRVADIGAGTGYFAVRLARAVSAGRVFAADIEPDMVRYIEERAKREGLANLEAVLASADDPRLPEPVDRVLIVNTVHHIGAREAYFRKLRGSLRTGGRVAIVDFRKGDLPVGPPDAVKLAPETVEAELRAAGFELQARHDFLPHQYMLVFLARPGA